MSQEHLLTLARWMAGDFSNREQAFREPAFFSQIRVCHRPLPYTCLNAIAFYVEQAYDVFLDDPYRMRVIALVPRPEDIYVINYNMTDPSKFRGACREPERLKSLRSEDLIPLDGCSMILKPVGGGFRGQVEPGKACKVFRKGKDSYLISAVEFREGMFFSLDRGYDPATDQQIWGSLGGPFEFYRRVDFSSEVPMTL